MPGLKPIYQPLFTDTQLEEVRSNIRKHSSPQYLVDRSKLVLLLHEHPDIENPVAARLLGHHENWVRYWRKRWASEGFSLKDRPRSGRKPTFSPWGASYG